MTRLRILLVAAVFVCVAGPLSAQVLERPTRGLFAGGPPPDPNRNHQELFAQATVLGGFDDNLAPASSGDTFVDRGSGYTGMADARLRYLFGRPARSIEAITRGYMNTYRNVGLGPSYGGTLDVNAQSEIGRRTSIDFSQSVAYAPYVSLGAFGALRSELGGASPDINTINAVNEDRVLSLMSTAHISRNWTRRFRSGGSYSYNRMTFEHGTGFDTYGHSGGLDLEANVSRTSAFQGAYRYVDTDYVTGGGTTRPMINQSVDAGYRYSRGLSRTRAITIAAGAGGTRVDTIDDASRASIQYWTPSGYGTLRYDFARSWNVSGDYRRSVSVLQGLNPEFFNSDTATARAGGALTRRLDAVFIIGYASGQAGEGSQGHYTGYTGSGQLRFQLTRSWSSTLLYNHYQYRLNEQAARSLGTSREPHRNAVMAGFNFSLPLVGTAPGSGPGHAD